MYTNTVTNVSNEQFKNVTVGQIQMSEHAQKRSQQRAIRMSDLEIALLQGERQWSHGDHVFTLTDRALRDTPHEKQADRLRGLCVVLTADNVIRTVKWNYRLTRRPGILRRSHHHRQDVSEIF